MSGPSQWLPFVVGVASDERSQSFSHRSVSELLRHVRTQIDGMRPLAILKSQRNSGQNRKSNWSLHPRMACSTLTRLWIIPELPATRNAAGLQPRLDSYQHPGNPLLISSGKPYDRDDF